MKPRAEQRRIVDLLARAEGIIRLRREAQQKAAELIPAIFIDMFGDPATNPKQWPVLPLGEVLASVDYGCSTKASVTRAGVPITRYVMQRIRDNHITGTSCTIVLIGARTHERKYVDWEIKATLDRQHGLLGVVLPTYSKTAGGRIIVPDRFLSNVNSGFASYLHWEQLTEDSLKNAVNAAVAAPTALIDNSLPMKIRNGYPRVKEMLSQWSDVRAIMRAIQDELVVTYKLIDVSKLQ